MPTYIHLYTSLNNRPRSTAHFSIIVARRNIWNHLHTFMCVCGYVGGWVCGCVGMWVCGWVGWAQVCVCDHRSPETNMESPAYSGCRCGCVGVVVLVGERNHTYTNTFDRRGTVPHTDSPARVCLCVGGWLVGHGGGRYASAIIVARRVCVWGGGGMGLRSSWHSDT